MVEEIEKPEARNLKPEGRTEVDASASATNHSSPITNHAPSSPVFAVVSHRFRIQPDVFNSAVMDLPEEHRTALKWLYNYCRSRNLGREEIQMLLKKSDGTFYSFDSIYQVLTGRRTEAGANIQPVVNAIEAFRRVAEIRAGQTQSGFIKTRLSEAVWKVCRKAFERNKVTFIFGDSQIGKTEALKEYQRQHNHGETIYVEAPSGGSVGMLMCEIARSLGIPSGHKGSEMHRKIIESFDDRMLLIVDEAHRLLKVHQGSTPIALDFLRELFNRAKCGIVLSMTNEGRDLFRNGRHAKALEQLWNRRITPLQLPKVPPLDDLALFAAAYGLDPASDKSVTIKVRVVDDHGIEREREHKDNPLRLQSHVLSTEGLGVWITILQDASDLAREAKKDITWGAVIKAYCLSQAEAETLV